MRKGATLREIYARARAEFTAADLQKYTVDEPMIPADDVLKDLEAIHQEETRKKNSCCIDLQVATFKVVNDIITANKRDQIAWEEEMKRQSAKIAWIQEYLQQQTSSDQQPSKATQSQPSQPPFWSIVYDHIEFGKKKQR